MPDPANSVLSIVKTKAHREMDNVSPDDLRNFLGNNKADELAKLGAALHETDILDVTNYNNAEKQLKALAFHVAQVLAMPHWFEDHKLKKLEQGSRLRDAHGLRGRHDLVWYKDAWTCCKCLIRIRPKSSHKQFISVCPGSSSLDEILRVDTGHCLSYALIEGGGVLYFCSVCFAFAETVPRKLTKPCAKCMGPFGPTAKTRIKNGFHPGDRHRLILKPHACAFSTVAHDS